MIQDLFQERKFLTLCGDIFNLRNLKCAGKTDKSVRKLSKLVLEFLIASASHMPLLNLGKLYVKIDCLYFLYSVCV